MLILMRKLSFARVFRFIGTDVKLLVFGTDSCICGTCRKLGGNQPSNTFSDETREVLEEYCCGDPGNKGLEVVPSYLCLENSGKIRGG